MDRRGDNQHALGTDPNNLSPLRFMRVPIPDLVVYAPASIFYVRADQTRVGDGPASLNWIYDVISRDRLATILEYLEGEDFAYLYVKSDKRDGDYAMPEEGYTVWYAIMYRPILDGKEGVPIARSATNYQSVKITFRLLSEHSVYL